MMMRFKKVLPIFLLFCCVNAYSAIKHIIEFDVANDTKYNTVVAFLFDTTYEKGPGAVVFQRTDKGTDSITYVDEVFGPSVSVKQASVKYYFFPYKNYAVNASCKNIDLQSIDSKGLFITMHINTASMSIDCTTVRIKQPL